MSVIKILSAWFVAQIGTAENPKGSNNVVYNTHYYGRPVSGPEYPWCASFIWVGFDACSLSKLFLNSGKSAYCPYIMNWAKQHGCWVTDNYREGDLLLYSQSGTGVADHIGYCISWNGSTATAIEGNYGDKVAKVRRDASEILGAYRPDYPDDIPEDSYPSWGDIPAVDPDEAPEWGDIPAVDPDETAPENQMPTEHDYIFKAGDIVRIKPGAAWYNGRTIPGWVFGQNWIIRSVNHNRAVLDKSENRQHRIMSAISTGFLSLVKTVDEVAVENASITEYVVQSGDTLWEIAQRFLGSGVKYKLIANVNNLESTDIFPGQILKIPGKD